MLLTATFGDGHMQVASALREVFHSRGVEVMEVNPWQTTHPAFAKAGQLLYEWTSRFFPRVYGASYNWTRKIPPSHWFWRMLRIFSHKVWRAVVQYQPDAVLQLFPDHGLAVRQSQPMHALVGIVLTDFGVHAHWFHARADLYFLPHSSLLQEARKFNRQGETFVTGIPLRRQFWLGEEGPLEGEGTFTEDGG
ncbi:hypothetical protein D2Q93_14985, partial [Alicyclobacillaceae bacterium I2511]